MSTEYKYKGRAIRFAVILLIALTFICSCGIEEINTYAASSSAAAAAASAPSATAQVNAKKGIYLRAKTSSKSKKVKKLKNNAKITIIKEVFLKNNSTKTKYIWYYVSAGSKKGYIPASKVDHIKYKTTKGITISDLNYRVGPNTKMTKKGTFRTKTVINVVQEAYVKGYGTKWYKILLGSKYYYVCSDWARLGTANVVKTVATPASMLKPANPAAVLDGDPAFTIKDATYPETLLQMIPFTLLGTVECTQEIQTARVGVLDSGGKWVLYKDLEVKSNKCEIVRADADIKFGTLKPGNYTYRVVVVVNGKQYIQINKSFTVKKSTGPQRLVAAAMQLAWPYGTPKSTYGSKPTEAYKFALDAAYPGHSSWAAGANTGASCDVFIGTVCDYSDVDTEVPRSLNKQLAYFNAHPEKWIKVPYTYQESELQSGDIIIYHYTNNGGQHVCMYVKIDGKGYVAEANYPKGYYGFINSSISKIFRSSDKEDFTVFRAAD